MTFENQVKKAKEYEVKYELSLTTLEEFKTRVEDAKKRNKQLEEQIKVFQSTARPSEVPTDISCFLPVSRKKIHRKSRTERK